MSVLAYSELLRRITGIDQETLELPFVILNKNNTTRKRLLIIKELAKKEKATIGQLLESVGLPRGGGSYLTIQDYFLSLEKEGLLQRTNVGKKVVWSFSEKHAPFKRFVLR